MLDPKRLRRALSNYLSNAIKFTSAGGRVCVRALADADEPFRVEVAEAQRVPPCVSGPKPDARSQRCPRPLEAGRFDRRRRQPKKESTPCGASGRGVAALVAATRIGGDAAGAGALWARRSRVACVLSDDRHRLAAACHGKRSGGGDRRRGQRRGGRNFALHGWRVHAEPRDGAKRGPGFSVECSALKAEFQHASVAQLLLHYPMP